MSTPAVIFSLGFEYDWKIGGYDYLEYMSRPEAFDKTQHLQDEYKDFIDYMSNEEKSDGLFDNDKNILNSHDKEKYREYEEVSREEGCPKYFGVISFDNKFLEQYGIIKNGTLQTDQLKNIGRTAINELISKSRKLDTTNVYWNAAIHTNTDNIHIHYSLCEYHRLEDRIKTCRTKDCIEVEAFDALKSKVINKLVGNEFSKQITEIVRNALLPEVSKRLVNCAEQFAELNRKLPLDAHTQYGRASMKDYRTDIDKITDSIIHSNAHLLSLYSSLEKKLDEQTEKLKELYGSGKRHLYLDYKKNRMDDFYQRAGNLILQHLSKERKNSASDLYRGRLSSEKRKSRFLNSDRLNINRNSDEFEMLVEQNGSIASGDNDKSYVDNLRRNNLYQQSLQLMFAEQIESEIQRRDLIRLIEYASTGDARASYALGKMFFDGKALSRNLDNAEKYFLQAEKSENPYSSYYLAKIFLLKDKKDTDKAIQHLELAEQNSKLKPHADFLLGKIYLSQEKYNPKKAEQYLLSAAEQNSNASLMLGKIYLYGIDGIAPNHSNAMKYLKKSKDQGNTYAKMILKRTQETEQKRYPRMKRYRTVTSELMRSLYMLRGVQNEMETHLQQLKAEYNRDFDNQVYLENHSLSI